MIVAETDRDLFWDVGVGTGVGGVGVVEEVVGSVVLASVGEMLVLVVVWDVIGAVEKGLQALNAVLDQWQAYYKFSNGTVVEGSCCQDSLAGIETTKGRGGGLKKGRYSPDLLVLDTRDIVDSQVVQSVKTVEEVGQRGYSEFCQGRLISRSKPVSKTIPHNILALFSRHRPKSPQKFTTAGDCTPGCVTSWHVIVSCQSRAINREDFFIHESHACNKSDLLQCLESHTNPVTDDTPSADTSILDGAALVHFLVSGGTKAFNDYAKDIFVPYIKKQQEKVHRVDLVSLDVYISDSLKSATRQNRGSGVRRRNWSKFLQVENNKKDRFDFLGKQVMIMCIRAEAQLYLTDDENVLRSEDAHFSNLSPCGHEEADSRMIIIISTVDGNVTILPIAFFERLSVDMLWIAFGTGKTFHYIPKHEIAGVIGSQKARFCGEIFPEVAFAFLVISPCNGISACVQAFLERFVVILYDRTSCMLNVNDCRRDLFTRKGRTSMKMLSPTKEALTQHMHMQRACFQAGHIWRQALVADSDTIAIKVGMDKRGFCVETFLDKATRGFLGL
ncbi:putative Nuclear pore membrane glycoprotein 210-like 2 [Homarus americanus]|uniref:Putative Nuclear pore membrane glycoprotein 210-like 2 n=1 Tax=Homarus americanus TaxID=6706 RepID=A0A8J5N705_HOMAM|nr:putative Nuclear pore membrane glycoprotein 210-like 2 [Homarus americanus]